MATATAADVTIHAAVVAALSELTEIIADETADTGTYKYRYASLAGIMRAVRPVCGKHGLAVSQTVRTNDGELIVDTALVFTTGETFSSGPMSMKLPPNPQQIGSLISYLRRYQLVALLGLAVEDDDARQVPAPTPGPARHTRPASAPAGLTDTQRRHIMALFRDLGLSGDANRDERLMITADIIGRPITSTNEVTPSEASIIITELSDRFARSQGFGEPDPEGY